MTKEEQIEYLSLDPEDGCSFRRGIIVKWLKYRNIYGLAILSGTRNYAGYHKRKKTSLFRRTKMYRVKMIGKKLKY